MEEKGNSFTTTRFLFTLSITFLFYRFNRILFPLCVFIMWGKERRNVDETEVTITKRRWDAVYGNNIYVLDLIVNMHNITFMIILLSPFFISFHFVLFIFLFVCVFVCFFLSSDDFSELFSFSSAVYWSLTLSCCASEILLHYLFFSPRVFLSETYVFFYVVFPPMVCLLFYWFRLFLLYRQNLLSFLSSACWNLVWNRHKLVCDYSIS